MATMRSTTTPFVVLCGALVACSGADAPDKLPLGAPPAETAITGLSAQLVATLDSGNVAFRAGNYPNALAFYSAASRLAPQSAAPYYGVMMVAQRIGDPALADSATRMIKLLSGEEAAGHADPSLPKAGDPHGGDPTLPKLSNPHAVPPAGPNPHGATPPPPPPAGARG